MFYTEEEVKKEIVEEQYIRVPRTTVMICALTVRNGFTFIGYSGAADPIKFDEIIGKTYAYKDAFKKALE